MVNDMLGGFATANISLLSDALLGDGAAPVDLIRGGLLGAGLVAALVIGIAALAQRRALGASALAMVALASIVMATRISGGVSSAFSASLLSAFVASALLFASFSLPAAKRSGLLGALFIAGAVSLAGVGAINFVFAGQATSFLNIASLVAGLGVAAAAFLDARAGERFAGVVFTGALWSIAALALLPLTPLSGVYGAAIFAVSVYSAAIFSVLPHGLGAAPLAAVGSFAMSEAESASTFQPSEAKGKSDTTFVAEPGRLENVLDYAGLAVWDWSKESVSQTPSLCKLLGAPNQGVFETDSFVGLLDGKARAAFEDIVIGVKRGDGSFDHVSKTASGGVVRLRGARAVSPMGKLERIIIFVEDASKGASASGAASTLETSSAGNKKSSGGASASKTLLTAAAASLAGAAAAGDRRRADDEVSLQDVAAAIDAGAIVPAFQPIVSLKDRAIVGYETLLRWPAREGDAAASAPAIVRAAQAAGRGRDLSELVVNAAAAKIAEARRGGDADDEVSAGFASGIKRLSKRSAKRGEDAPFAAFNVSVSQLMDHGFAEAVKDAVKTHDLPARSLVLEVTETEQFADAASLEKLFSSLRKAGVALAMDDFGAGFSSFANLNKFQFDYLKIDKSFVEDMAQDKGAHRIVAALAGLGKDLGLTVIAEGVENEATAADLAAAGCSLAQGYLFGDVTIAPKVMEKPDAKLESAALEDIAQDVDASDDVLIQNADEAPGDVKAEADTRDIEEEPKAERKGFGFKGLSRKGGFSFGGKDKERASTRQSGRRSSKGGERADLAEVVIAEAPASSVERRAALAEDLQTEQQDPIAAPTRRRMSSRTRRLR